MNETKRREEEEDERESRFTKEIEDEKHVLEEEKHKLEDERRRLEEEKTKFEEMMREFHEEEERQGKQQDSGIGSRSDTAEVNLEYKFFSFVSIIQELTLCLQVQTDI